MNRVIRSLITAAIGLLAGGYSRAETSSVVPPIGAQPQHAKVVVIPIHGPIEKPVLYTLRRGVKDAIEAKADTVILDLDTPGGRLDVTFDMLKVLEKFPGTTVAFVNREAGSAGALISAGTDQIYFAPGSIIGAAAPVLSNGGDIGETMKAKLVSYLTARMRSISEGKGYRGEVISAMIDEDSEFKIGDTVLKEKGKLLMLTASEAMKSYGNPPQPLLGSGISNSLDELLANLHGTGNYTVRIYDVSWSELLAQYLIAITPLLTGIGILALIIELKTPGFGVFGITGIVLFGIVFLSQSVAGLSGHEPILFFVLGLALLALELFIFPGVMVMAMAGVILMLGSLVWAMTDLWPNEPITITGQMFVRPLASVIGAVVIAVVLFLALLKFLPQGGIWGNMILHASVGGEPGPARALAGMVPAVGHHSLVGQSGIAATPLFPSGQVEIAGRRYEARLGVGFADAGTPVKVTGVAEFGLAVEVLA